MSILQPVAPPERVIHDEGGLRTHPAYRSQPHRGSGVSSETG